MIDFIHIIYIYIYRCKLLDVCGVIVVWQQNVSHWSYLVRTCYDHSMHESTNIEKAGAFLTRTVQRTALRQTTGLCEQRVYELATTKHCSQGYWVHQSSPLWRRSTIAQSSTSYTLNNLTSRCFYSHCTKIRNPRTWSSQFMTSARRRPIRNECFNSSVFHLVRRCS